MSDQTVNASVVYQWTIQNFSKIEEQTVSSRTFCDTSGDLIITLHPFGRGPECGGYVSVYIWAVPQNKSESATRKASVWFKTPNSNKMIQFSSSIMWLYSRKSHGLGTKKIFVCSVYIVFIFNEETDSILGQGLTSLSSVILFFALKR
jgi:hypothetical protein